MRGKYITVASHSSTHISCRHCTWSLSGRRAVSQNADISPTRNVPHTVSVTTSCMCAVCVESTCPPDASVGFLWVLRFPHNFQNICSHLDLNKKKRRRIRKRWLQQLELSNSPSNIKLKTSLLWTARYYHMSSVVRHE